MFCFVFVFSLETQMKTIPATVDVAKQGIQAVTARIHVHHIQNVQNTAASITGNIAQECLLVSFDCSGSCASHYSEHSEAAVSSRLSHMCVFRCPFLQ